MPSIDELAVSSIIEVGALTDIRLAEMDNAVNSILREINIILGSQNTALNKTVIREVINNAGVNQVINDTLNNTYQEILRINMDLYKEMFGDVIDLSDEALSRLNSIKELDLDQFNDLMEQTISNINRQVTNFQFNNIGLEDAASNITDIINTQFGNYSKTWINTATSGFYQSITNEFASEMGIDKYKYVGPDDKLTRPFCDKYIGKIKTKKQWDNLNNGQINPISTWRGGYNCRHQLVAWVDR